MSELWEKHSERLEASIDACRSREYWTPFQESPSSKIHGRDRRPDAEDWFAKLPGTSFDLDLPGSERYTPPEVSPYTGHPLGIDYPRSQVSALVSNAAAALPAWSEVSPRERVAVCMEILDALEARSFENAYATMHTTGQGFMMAFAGSGANSLDRGLEAIAHAHMAMSQIPSSSRFVRRFGRDTVTIDKTYSLRPRGVAAVIACASYPAWNVYPALFANLATGNPVVLKPHPETVLPVALVARIGREVLRSHGYDENLLTLAIDAPETPVAAELAADPAVAIIDFTGSQKFGSWLEANFHEQLYTETSGCNAVVLHSADDLDAVLKSVAHGIALFSSQMCTAPQNIWIGKNGVATPNGIVSVDEVADRLARAIEGWCSTPERAAALCGALQSERTLAAIDTLTSRAPSIVLGASRYEHPEFPAARTSTPLLVRCDAADREYFQREHFGPMAFIITAESSDEALAAASRDAGRFGAIASYVYSTDDAFVSRAESLFWRAGASIACNLIKHLPIGYAAAFSDYHVTGLNPAGNACLTDQAFVASRFRIVQSKRERPAST